MSRQDCQMENYSHELGGVNLLLEARKLEKVDAQKEETQAEKAVRTRNRECCLDS